MKLSNKSKINLLYYKIIMETLLEGIFRDIIVTQFFTEQRVETRDSMGNSFRGSIQSPSEIAVRTLMGQSTFLTTELKDVLTKRLMKIVSDGKADEIIAKSVGEYIKLGMSSSSWNKDEVVKTIERNLPHAIATQILSGEPSILSVIDIKGIKEKIKNGEMKIEVTLK